MVLYTSMHCKNIDSTTYKAPIVNRVRTFIPKFLKIKKNTRFFERSAVLVIAQYARERQTWRFQKPTFRQYKKTH
jgi:hypothetical protein